MESLIIACLVFARIAATTWANVVQKRQLTPANQSPLALFTAVWGWMTLLTLPWWLGTFSLGTQFWSWMLLACLLEVPGNVLLLRSLRATDLSIFAPLSSAKPAISLLLACILFAELPSWPGMLGVAIILLGSLLLTVGPRDSASSPISIAQKRAGVRDRLLSVLLTAMASVFLKRTLEDAGQWQVLSAWCLLSWLLAAGWTISATALESRRRLRTSTINIASTNPVARPVAKPRPLTTHVWVAVTMLVMQGCTIALFARMHVGYALALFQIGSLVGVFVGHRLFGEGDLVRRTLAALVMVAGALLIVLFPE
ncbi:MAG: hypothetical protein IT423_20470 [Pirellulaceae bacterium]|nr:hypothetical protein [Pirellulaceae bacterium]